MKASSPPPPTTSAPYSSVTLVTVDEGHDGQRIDNFLLGQLKGVPRTLIYRILRKGEVRVNKGRAKPELRLATGDIVRIPPVRLPERDEPARASQNLLDVLTARIVYEDKHLIAVDKPAGLAVHGGSGINLGLIEAMRQLRPQEQQLELVHRLDRDTSGLILIAKKRSTLTALHAMLRDGGIDKRYLAVVHGHWPARISDVRAPLKKNQLASGERFVRVNPTEGKPSHTGFTVLERYQDLTLVEAKPYTGRTHQIRVHAQHAGHPLACDDKYASREQNQQAQQLGFRRLCLHAHSLSFRLPATGELLELQAPLPDDIAKPLGQLARKP